MMKALGHLPNAVGVARIYKGLIDAMVIDEVDTSLTPLINKLGHQVWLEQTVMRTRADKKNLAKNIVKRFKSVEE